MSRPHAPLATAIGSTPERWRFVVANPLVGLTYTAIGALAGVGVGRLGGTYLMLATALGTLAVVACGK